MIATIIILCLLASNLTINLVKNGEPKDETYNFILSLVSAIIEIVLYYYAGLFDKFSNI